MTPTGNLPASQTLNLAIGLPLRNREALTNLLEQLYDPASPVYHQYPHTRTVHGKVRPNQAGLRGSHRVC